MHFDFQHAVQAPFRMQPGLRRLAPGSPQLTPNRPGARHLREKLAVLTNWPEEALLSQPGFDPGPALARVAEQAAREHPQAWQLAPGGGWHAVWLGWAVTADGQVQPRPDCVLPEVGACLQALAPEWRQPGLMALAFAEDFAIVDGAAATLPWLAVALPSNWSPREKIGRHFAEVHAPVADNQLLVTAGAHLMRLVTGTDRWERFVWNISRHPRLHSHPDRVETRPWPAELSAEALAAAAWLRTERQTFVPLPERQQAVFTILVHSAPLAEAVQQPDDARRLHDALASMSPAVLAYRSLSPARDRLLAWLAQRAGPAPATAAAPAQGPSQTS